MSRQEVTVNLDQMENALAKMTMKTCETYRMVIDAQQAEIKRLKDKYEPNVPAKKGEAAPPNLIPGKGKK